MAHSHKVGISGHSRAKCPVCKWFIEVNSQEQSGVDEVARECLWVGRALVYVSRSEKPAGKTAGQPREYPTTPHAPLKQAGLFQQFHDPTGDKSNSVVSDDNFYTKTPMPAF